MLSKYSNSLKPRPQLTTEVSIDVVHYYTELLSVSQYCIDSSSLGNLDQAPSHPWMIAYCIVYKDDVRRTQVQEVVGRLGRS